MAVYPRTAEDRVVPPEPLRLVVSGIFAGCGMSREDADLLAHTLVLSDLRGIHSHGVLRVPDYVKKLTLDGVDPRAVPKVVTDRGGAIVVDACNAMGQIAGTFAMRAAIARARQTGLALAAVRGSNHCGAMDYYTLLAVNEGMVGIAGTNALPTMAPWGGIDKIVGINPVSIAVPANTVRSVVLDFAFGATAHGKIRVYHQKGAPIPEGWAFDRHGKPTTEAAEALHGLIQPIGQHKGVGLGMMVGILSTLLSGAAYGTESGNMIDGARPGVDGHFFLAIDVSFFVDPEEFRRRVDGIVQQVHGSGRAKGTDRLLVPGQLEAELEDHHGSSGIPLAATTFNDILEAAERFVVDARDLAPEIGGA
jgi:LDH2 family malate/lactate/ureidoglycolate dehydrogenase